MNRYFLLFCLALLVILPACKRAPAHQEFSNPIALSPVDVDAAEPALAPGPGGGAFIAWVQHQDSNADVVVARIDRTGALVNQPVRVNPTPGMATAWRGDPPSLSIAPDGTVFITWTARTATPDGKKATDVMLSVSHDGGQTFAPPLRINDDSAPADHGMHSLLAAADGKVYVAWLDGRNPQPEISMPSAVKEQNTPINAEPKAMHHEGNRELFFAASTDGGKTFSKNQRIAGQVCPCCKTDLAQAPDGRIYVSWRQVLPGSFRHISVASSTDGGNTFGPSVVVSDDAWRLMACPVSGGSLEAGADGTLRVMWYAAGDAGEAGVYETVSADNGRTFQPRRLFSAGSARGMPYLNSLNSGSDLGVWEGGEGAIGGIQFGLTEPKGDAVVTKIGDGTNSTAARTDGQIFVAWVGGAGKRAIMLARTSL